MADVQIENAGSIVLIRPLTDAGRNWVEHNIQAEDWQHFGGAIAAEPRTVEAVIEGMRGDGLDVTCV
jgi:hypothetical protein